MLLGIFLLDFGYDVLPPPDNTRVGLLVVLFYRNCFYQELGQYNLWTTILHMHGSGIKLLLHISVYILYSGRFN
jgi:hypothetical protein